MILEIMLINELNIFVMVAALVATALTVIYSCRLTLGLFGEERMRESYRGERDFDTAMAVRIGILVFPSIAGGWFLRGLMGSGLLVYLRATQKLFIMLIVLSSGLATLIAANIKFRSRSKLFNLLHQIWFMPILFRVKLTSEGLFIAKDRVKLRDIRWSESVTWI